MGGIWVPSPKDRANLPYDFEFAPTAAEVLVRLHEALHEHPPIDVYTALVEAVRRIAHWYNASGGLRFQFRLTLPVPRDALLADAPEAARLNHLQAYKLLSMNRPRDPVAVIHFVGVSSDFAESRRRARRLEATGEGGIVRHI